MNGLSYTAPSIVVRTILLHRCGLMNNVVIVLIHCTVECHSSSQRNTLVTSLPAVDA